MKRQRVTSKFNLDIEVSKSLLTIDRFNTFFTHLDNYKDPQFLYLTSGGIEATKRKREDKSTQQKYEEDSEDENASGGEG